MVSSLFNVLWLGGRGGFGVDQGNGEIRYCNMANGGPMSVYVKDGKIVRMTPITFDDRDPQPWTIEARYSNPHKD